MVTKGGGAGEQDIAPRGAGRAIRAVHIARHPTPLVALALQQLPTQSTVRRRKKEGVVVMVVVVVVVAVVVRWRYRRV